MLMHKILQNHLLCAFVANLKIGAIYALYPESFCDKNLAIRKVFAFCDSEPNVINSAFYLFLFAKYHWISKTAGLCIFIWNQFAVMPPEVAFMSPQRASGHVLLDRFFYGLAWMFTFWVMGIHEFQK